MAVYNVLNEVDYYPRTVHDTLHSPIRFGYTSDEYWQRWVTSSLTNVSVATAVPVWFGTVRCWLNNPLWDQGERNRDALDEVMRLRKEAGL